MGIMSKRPSSKQWLERQNKDIYTKQARKSHYRSRAVYKLVELDEKYRLFKSGQTVVDLGAAPGSWSQYVVEKTGAKGKVLAVDILEMDNLIGVDFIQGDFTEDMVYQRCLKYLNKSQADLVISDMAPNMSGIKDADQARSMHLAELVLEMAENVLKPGGHMLLKCFQGSGIEQYQKLVQQRFTRLRAQKPRASRGSSREFYMLAQTFKL